MNDVRPQPPGFFRGLTYPLRGVRFVFRTHRSLARYWIVPVIITLAAFIVLGTVVAQQHSSWVDRVWQPSHAPGLVGSITTVLHFALDYVLAIAVFAIGAFGILLSSSVVAAPFNEALSAAVERIEGTLAPSVTTWASVVGDVARSVAMEVGKLLILAAIMVPLLAFNLVLPVVGGPLLAIVGPLITVSYIAIDYTDWPAARRGVGLRGRLKLLRSNPAPFLGFGVAAWALLFVPGLNLVLMPAAVAGGTLLYLDLEVRGRGEASVDASVGPAFPS